MRRQSLWRAKTFSIRRRWRKSVLLSSILTLCPTLDGMQGSRSRTISAVPGQSASRCLSPGEAMALRMASSMAFGPPLERPIPQATAPF